MASDPISIAHVADSLPQDWKYVSEGGATIVFSYIGPSNPQFNGTVLRLRKSPVLAPADDTLVEDEPDDPMIEYQHKCMERLIPREHLPRLESARLDRYWLELLAASHGPERPLDRRQKDQIDVGRTKGVLATDLVGGEGLAVEIKPKWAFLPSPTHLSPATRSIKTRTCRFCMHSHMKSGQGAKVSLGYCPLDLFSGDKSRITRAVHTLWDAWVESDGTVNNLKIFLHGRMVKPSDDPSPLATELSQDPTSAMAALRTSFTSAVLPLLTDTPVLRNLSKLQRTLDVLDIEGLSTLWHRTELSSPLYKSALPIPSSTATYPGSSIGVSSPYLSSPDPSIQDWSDFLDTYISSHTRMDHASPVPDNLRYYLLAYLLSATFKDCSIILRLDRATGENRVTVIDLDPKSMDRLRKWEKLDREIVEGYAGVGEPRKCIDGWAD